MPPPARQPYRIVDSEAGYPAGATAEFGNTLNFQAAPGATTTTVTTIGMTVHIDGSLAAKLTGDVGGSGSPFANFAIYVGLLRIRVTSTP